MAGADAFGVEFDRVQAAGEPAFTVDLDGFEGPLDLLLELARRQKVDLSRISILALAEQYLEFVEAARKLRLELAADYLVMAAWLAFLKSRLLLPAAPAGRGSRRLDARRGARAAPARAGGDSQGRRVPARPASPRPRLLRQGRAGADRDVAPNDIRGQPLRPAGGLRAAGAATRARARALQDARGLVARRGARGVDPAHRRTIRLDRLRRFPARSLRRFRDAPKRARLLLFGLARARARGKTRDPPGEGLRAALAAPERSRAGRGASRLTVVIASLYRGGAVPGRKQTRLPGVRIGRSHSREALHEPHDRHR